MFKISIGLLGYGIKKLWNSVSSIKQGYLLKKSFIETSMELQLSLYSLFIYSSTSYKKSSK